MQDIELYGRLLGLKRPWFVEKVELNVKAQQVDVYAGHAEGVNFSCPECGKACSVYDHSRARSWRHLDTMQFKTILHARPPRIECDKHGVKQVRLPWAEDGSHFTALFERLAIDVLLGMPVKGAAALLRISWDEAWGIKNRSVLRGLARKKSTGVEYMGVDEKSFAKRHQYVTIVYDLKKSCVEYVTDDKTKAAFEEYLGALMPEEKSQVRAVAMDMAEGYINAAKDHLPEADIVHDKFHVMAEVSDAVDKVRRREHKELQAQGDDTLTHARYTVLKRTENLTQKDRTRLEVILAKPLKTARAWSIQEALRDMWRCDSGAEAELVWKKIYFWATHSKLPPMIKAFKKIQRHLPDVLTYFKHRITNACGEAINGVIQTLKHMARGYRNRSNFQIAIYFHCGGLDLYPETHVNVG